MAYDRYDTRRDRETSRHPDDYRSGRRDERGFFERAGDEIASWFGDRDDDDRDYSRGRDRNWAPAHGWGGDPERGRDYRSRERERERDRGFMPERGYSRTGFDADYDDRTGDRGRERSYRPMTGDYGRSEERGRTQWGREEMRRTAPAGATRTGGREQDRHYSEWRQRQLDELDRDYDDYHRERQQKFEDDFGSWRQTRQQKRQMLGQAREHMTVVGSDGETLGKVDKVAGDRLILAKSDSPDGRHHSIPCTFIDKVEGDRVMLDCTTDQAQKHWRDEDRGRALFEREDQGEAGPHMLDRSFSGTYRD